MEEKNNYYPILGSLYKKFDAVQVNDTFRKREFVLEVTSEWNGKTYTELITFEMIQDACDKLDYVEFGEPIEVMFALRGREYDKKDGSGKGYFNSVKATHITSKKVVVPKTDVQASAQSVNNAVNEEFDNDTGLPF